MFISLARFVSTFAVICAAFGAYRLAVVPWIEPSIQPARVDTMSMGDLSDADSGGISDPEIRDLFPQDAWERNEPKTLKTSQGELLFQQYYPKEDAQLEIKPCTLIFQSESEVDAEKRSAPRVVVMQAPEGATLNFDSTTSLSRGQVGQITGGMMMGPIVIRSPASEPGADDAFELHTRNVQITPERIVTPHEVSFRYGKNHGVGRDLIINLASRASESAVDSASGAAFGEVQSIELVNVDSVRLYLDKNDKWKGSPTAPQSEDGPIEVGVTCGGSFRFDVPSLTASFRDHVDVIREDMPLPCDQLHCDYLAVRFVRRTSGEDAPVDADAGSVQSGGTSSEPSSLRVQSVLATGAPAVLKAPSYFADVEAGELEYNFETRNVRIEDEQKLMLRYKSNSVQARGIDYQLAEDDGIGQGQVIGPGTATGLLDDDPSKPYEISWQDRLVVQPHRGQHALSLLSKASVQMNEMGHVQAEALHVWLSRTVEPPEAGQEKPRVSYDVDRLLAERDVHFDSPQISGDVQRAEIWLRDAEPSPRAAASLKSTIVHASAADAGSAGTGASLSRFTTGTSQQKYDLQGQGLQLQLVRSGKQISVEHLIVDGDVRFQETRTTLPNEIPLDIRAQLVQMRNANGPAAEVFVQGSPAEIGARGMVMSGDDIRLHRGDNRMWIEGPGKMVLPEPANQSESQSDTGEAFSARMAGPMTVTWSQSMDFNGLTARFNRDVQVRGRQVSKQGELFDLMVMGHELAVSLDQRVDFSSDDLKTEASVRTLAFIGGVYLQNISSQQGTQTSLDQMQVRDLQIDQRTGRLQALGPGWGTSVRHDETFNRETVALSPGQAPGSRSGLAFVRVDFEDEIRGNIHERELTFRGRVHTVYGPVQEWNQTLDPDPAEGLAEGQFLMTSQALSLTDMSEHTPGSKMAIELAATGNATIESREFTARGWRISYARAKEMLVLEGDGRNDAELWLEGSRTRDAAAQQVRFWTNDKSIEVDGGRFLNLSQLSNMTRR